MNTEKLKAKLRDLEVHREELRVQMHLARAEVRDEWDETEKKLKALQKKVAAARDKTEKASRELGEDLRIVADEIGSAYRRIRERLQDH